MTLAPDPNIELALVEALPFPVAYPLHRALSVGVARDRLDNALFAAYQAMRLTGLTLLAAYIAHDERDPRLARALDGLEFAQWGKWRDLTARLADHFADGPQVKSPAIAGATRLARAWLDVDRTRPSCESWDAALLAGLPGNTQDEAASAYDALSKLRNDRAHRTATLEPSQERGARKLLERIANLVLAVAKHLFVDTELRLARRGSNGGDFEELSGWTKVVSSARTEPIVLIGRADDACVLELSPLVRTCAVEAASEEAQPFEPVMLLDELRRNSVTFLGVHRSERRGVEEIQPALLRLDAPPKATVRATATATWAETFRRRADLALAELLARNVYQPARFFCRAQFESLFKIGIEDGGAGLFVTGEPGSGKSALLAHLVARSRRERPNDVIAFLFERLPNRSDRRERPRRLLEDALRACGSRANVENVLGEIRQLLEDFPPSLAPSTRQFVDQLAASREAAEREADVRLRDALLSQGGLAPTSPTATLSKTVGELHAAIERDLPEARLVIVFDAIDDDPALPALASALDDLARQGAGLRQLRLVVATRSSAMGIVQGELTAGAWREPIGAGSDTQAGQQTEEDRTSCIELAELTLEERVGCVRAISAGQATLPAEALRLLRTPLMLRVGLAHTELADKPHALLRQVFLGLPRPLQKALRVFATAMLRQGSEVVTLLTDPTLGEVGEAEALELLSAERLVEVVADAPPGAADAGSRGWRLTQPLLGEVAVLEQLRNEMQQRQEDVVALLTRYTPQLDTSLDGPLACPAVVTAFEVVLREAIDARRDELLPLLRVTLTVGSDPLRTRLLDALIPDAPASADTALETSPDAEFARALDALTGELGDSADGRTRASRVLSATKKLGGRLLRTGRRAAARVVAQARVRCLSLLSGSGEAAREVRELTVDLARERRRLAQCFDPGSEEWRSALGDAQSAIEGLERNGALSPWAARDLGIVLSMLSTRVPFTGQPEAQRAEKLAYLERSVDYLTRAANADPSEAVSVNLAISMSMLSNTLAEKPEGIAPSEPLFLDSCARFESVLARLPRDYDARRCLAIAYGARGRGLSQRRAGHEARAEGLLGEAIRLIRDLVAEHPDAPDLRRDLAMNVIYRANALTTLGRAEEAEHLFNEGTELMRRLAVGDPRTGYLAGHVSALYYRWYGLRDQVREGQYLTEYLEAAMAQLSHAEPKSLRKDEVARPGGALDRHAEILPERGAERTAWRAKLDEVRGARA